MEGKTNDYMIYDGMVLFTSQLNENDVVQKVTIGGKITMNKGGKYGSLLKETFKGSEFMSNQLESIVKNYARYRQFYSPQQIKDMIIKFGVNNLKIIDTLKRINLLYTPKRIKRKRAKTR
ncbi:MAG: hypothetical protein V3U54_07695 [Thermodesulfobacteriota bacterium]